ncbi:MAG: DUF2513 domain-containing protein [Ruminococcus sp.]|nr:DUF2513 domain-containing protein [Ruminococcus sp.]
MKLDLDVIREVLLYIEKETKYIETEITDKDLELVFGCAKTIDSAPISLLKFVDEGKCNSIAEALYVLRKLEDGGYIITTESEKTPTEKASCFPSIERKRDSEELKSKFSVLDITFKGIEFLNLIRDNDVWNTYKNNHFIMSFEVINQMIPKLATLFEV